MRHSVTITTPYPTPEHVARTYGIPARRAKELRKLIEESLAEKISFHKNGGASSLSKNGARRKAAKAGSVSRRKRKRGKAKRSH